MKYQSATGHIREGLFRANQPFTDEHIELSLERDTITGFLIYELIDRSVKKGFVVTNHGNETAHSKNDEIQKVLGPLYEDWIEAQYWRDAFGISCLKYWDKPNDILRAFQRRDVWFSKNDHGELDGLRLKEHISDDHKPRLVYHPHVSRHYISKKALESAHLMIRPGKRNKSGLSKLEGIWDLLWAMKSLVSNMTYYVIRKGAGLKVAYVSNENLDDAEYMAELEESLQNMNAQDSTIILGIEIGKDTDPTKLELLGATEQLNSTEVMELYLTYLSIRTNIPVTVLKGITPGQIEGADTNEQLYFDVISKIQDECKPSLKWLIGILNKKYKWFSEEEKYGILFNTRIQISDQEKQKLLKAQSDNLALLLKMGVKKEIAAKLVGIALKKSDFEEIETDLKDGDIDTEEGTDRDESKAIKPIISNGN